MSSAYLLQLEQKVTLLMNDAKYKQAYDLCNSVLEKFPNEKSFVKIKEKIEYLVEEKNSQLVEEKLDSLELLWKEEKYADIIRILKDTLRLSPKNKRALKLEEKAQKAYQEQITKLRSDFKIKQRARLTEILEKNPAALPDELYVLETNNAKDPEVFALTKQFRDQLIEKRINGKKDLLNSNKYEAIQSFIEQLRKIDQKSPAIAKLTENLLLRRQERQINSTKEFVYKGEQYLDTMMKLKKFDKVMQAAEEILSIEPSNKAVTKIYQAAKQKFFFQSRDAIVQKMQNELPKLQAAYEQNSSNFLKL